MMNIETFNVDIYEEVMDVNLKSAIILTQLCILHLINSKGMIDLNIDKISI